MAYEFSRLSPADFEDLTHDLLQATWKTKLEAFRTGRDGGIDLRYLSYKGGTIVQCKHYSGSSFSHLISKLNQDEKVKVTLLAPQRYVLVTSLRLTPANKLTIKNSLSPFILIESDIFGADDLEALLREYPKVETTHFKLWLTSTAVLERVLFNAEKCLTDFRVDQIIKKIPKYVQTDAFQRASKILRKSRYVIISGPPGIGKTTLAEILIYNAVQAAYEPVVVQSDIVEGRKFFRPDRRQIFYFDDFLGKLTWATAPSFSVKIETRILVSL